MTPELQVEQVPVGTLHPDPANPRRIGEAELDALCRSIETFDLVSPIIVRRANGVVIGGHQRLVAAIRLGLKEVPVTYLEVTAEQARLLSLALNAIHGEWDEALLSRLLADLDATPDADLSLTGFAEDEIRTLLRSLDAREKRARPEHFDLDTALEEVIREPQTKRGNIWQLGEHRLLCGDSTDPAAVAPLTTDVTIRMAFTDPPYNVAYGEHGGQAKGARKRRIANDALSPEAFAKFCRAWATPLFEAVTGACYVCMSTKEWPAVSRILAEVGGHWSDTIIWAKDRHVLGRADYQRRYEPLWYGWPDGAMRHWCGDRDQTDIWEIPRPAVSDLHPTMKPLPLVERAIANSSEPGDVVLDLFLGSGTTLIAAERTGRICHAVELDPHYCDVIVARWEAFTDEKAVQA